MRALNAENKLLMQNFTIQEEGPFVRPKQVSTEI